MQNSNNTGSNNACGSSCAEALPFIILALAVMLSLMLQLQQSLGDRTTLQQVRDGQTQALAQSKDVQDRLDRLAVATVRLAEAGNANAKTLVERMKQAGITVNPSKSETVTEAVTSAPAEPADKK
jgi:hypothetical protein